MKKLTAIYPGSFDPVTFGHLDLIKRARSLFDRIYVVVSINASKNSLFSVEERVQFMKQATRKMPEVVVESYEGLTVNYAKKKKAGSVIRGLRATSDFDYEFQMAVTNRKLSKAVESVFLMPSENHFYLSSRLIKEIASLNGSVEDYVPAFVAKALKKRLKVAK